MANNILLGAGRVVYAAIMHIPNNDYRYTNVGLISALRSPQSSAIIAETDPFNAADQGRIAAHKAGSTNPRVTVNYKPAIAGTYSTTRQKLEAGSLTGATNPNAASTTEIVFDEYIETIVEGTTLTNNILKERDAQNYINGILAGKMSVSGSPGSKIGEKVQALLGEYGLTFAQKADSALLVPINAVLATNIGQAVGKNAAFPDAVSPSAASPQVPVHAFNTDGTPSRDLFDAIYETRLKNRFQGRPIAVGGSVAEKYFRTQNIVGLRDTGYELASIISLTDVEFYYDATLDSDELFIIEPNAACMQVFTQHSTRWGIVDRGRHKNTDFGTAELMLAQARAANSNVPETLMLPFDFRALEDMDDNDFPIDVTALSMKYGTYTRPVSFLTTDSGNILKDVTGIYHFQLTTAS